MASIIEECRKLGYSIELLDRVFGYELLPAICYYENEWSADYSIYGGYDRDWLKQVVPAYTNYHWITERNKISWLKKLLRHRLRYADKDKVWQRVIAKLNSEELVGNG